MTPKMTSTATMQPTQHFQIGRTTSLEAIETILLDIGDLDTDLETSVDLKLAASADREILVDLWSAIATGTLSRKRALRLVAWGLQQEIDVSSIFAKKPSFWVGLATATAISSEKGCEIDRGRFRSHLAIAQKGLVDTESANEQTLVEFDPDYSITPLFRGGEGFAPVSPLARKGLFNQLVLKFRQKLEIGAIRRGVQPVNSGAAASITKFLSELHENGLEHGSRDANGVTVPGTRFLRVKKHVANKKELLLDRCRGFDELAMHVETGLPDAKTPALIEASISDFGLGIVDGFLNSAAGRGVSVRRDDLLQAIIYDRLSSKSADPSAGLGIQKALLAAEQMGAFVSLRTGEFWLTASFAKSNPGIKLCHRPHKALAQISGTHWQIFWQQH